MAGQSGPASMVDGYGGATDADGPSGVRQGLAREAPSDWGLPGVSHGLGLGDFGLIEQSGWARAGLGVLLYPV